MNPDESDLYPAGEYEPSCNIHADCNGLLVCLKCDEINWCDDTECFSCGYELRQLRGGIER